MSDQSKKEETPQPKATEEKPQEKAEHKTEAKPKEKPAGEVPKKEEKKEAASPSGGGAPKKVKISQMGLPEVERELKNAKEKMGGFSSRYAQDLLDQKKELAGK
ncbi:MAG: hypothetical protein HY582_02800 [Candidatus Omnitrophica bacterium]|nr:hypothetical protein [Candidatus Omnitrophota bacterium]